MPSCRTVRGAGQKLGLMLRSPARHPESTSDPTTEAGSAEPKISGPPMRACSRVSARGSRRSSGSGAEFWITPLQTKPPCTSALANETSPAAEKPPPRETPRPRCSLRNQAPGRCRPASGSRSFPHRTLAGHRSWPPRTQPPPRTGSRLSTARRRQCPHSGR